MFGERLKEARTAAGHNQTSLAELLDIQPKQLWRWESGKSVPEGETIALLAKMLNVSADYLLGLTDDPKRAAQTSDLSQREQDIIMALRRGDEMGAIRVIANKG